MDCLTLYALDNIFVSCSIALACVIATLHLIPRLSNWGYKLPPGPATLPIVGYYPFFSKEPHLNLEKLRNKYGNVMGMYVGSKFLVVLSDFNSIRKNFNKEEFLGRPKTFFRVSPDKENFAEMNGQEWLDHRRFAVNSLKILYGPAHKHLEEKIQEEVMHFLPKIRAHINKPKMFIREVLTPSVNNVIFSLVTGTWYDDDHVVMKCLSQFEDAAALSFSNISILYFFPWLANIYNKLNPTLRQVNKCAKQMEEFVQEEVEKHVKALDENHPRDYIDHYLIEMAKSNVPDTHTMEALVGNCLFLLAAGSDTVRNTLEWSLLIMAKYPDIQEKVHKEIVDNFGTDHLPSWSNRAKIPYTEAVVMEVTRWRSLTVLNCLREVTADTKINEYDIPKGSYVINSIWACHMNPEEWPEPDKFSPERFLSTDGQRVIQKENLIPFSYGRRNCPGDKMAKIEVYLFFAAMMQKFRFVPPEGGLSFETYVKINAQSLHPFVKVLNREVSV